MGNGGCEVADVEALVGGCRGVVVVGGSRGVAAGEQIEVGLDFVVLIARRG